MIHWESYVRASWVLIMEAEGRSQEYLDTGIESYLVHTMARTFDKSLIWGRPVATAMLEAQSLPRYRKKEIMQRVGEECLFIDAWQIRQRRWPSPTYFADMGAIAFGTAAVSTRPADDLLDAVSNNFSRLSKVLRTVRDLGVR